MRRGVIAIVLSTLLGAAPIPWPGEMGALAQVALNARQDGESLETAIIVKAERTREGIAAEYEFIRKRFPGWRVAGQALLSRDARHYDRIEIVSPEGERRAIYFDVTAFFGKL